MWNKSFQLVSEKESFHQRIIIPDEVSKEGLRKKVDIILTQNGKSKKESAILSILRPGISNSIGDISQAIQNMRYILRDDEWKKFEWRTLYNFIMERNVHLDVYLLHYTSFEKSIEDLNNVN